MAAQVSFSTDQGSVAGSESLVFLRVEISRTAIGHWLLIPGHIRDLTNLKWCPKRRRDWVVCLS